MTNVQNVCEDVTTPRRKRFKIYSEFNCFKKAEEYLLSNINRYSNFKDIRPKLTDHNNHIVKSVHDEGHEISPNNDNINNVYQRERILQSQSKKTTESTHKTEHGSDLNNTCADNCYYGYFGTDVTRLLLDMEYTYNTMQGLLNNEKTSKMQRTSDFSSILLVIDSKKIDKFFEVECLNKFMKNKRKQYRLGGDISYATNTSSVLLNNTNNAFDITIAQQCIGFKILICKYLFSNLMETISALCTRFPARQYPKVPSLCTRDWYFLNISQGYILSLLLKKQVNNTLFVMRKVYFVLITEKKSNINIQIKCILKKPVFMVFEADWFNTYFNETVIWNSGHHAILCTSTFLYILYIFHKFVVFPKMFMNAITYYENPVFHDEEFDKSVDYENMSETCGIDDTTFTYSDFGSVNIIRSDFTINITINKSVETSFIFSIEDISCPYKELETKSASTLCNTIFESDSNTSFFTFSKLFLFLLEGTKKISTCLNLKKKEDYINETMFEGASTDLYVKFVNKYLKRFACQTFCKDIFKCLAQSVVNILFSFRI